jgi:sugar phosphate isomerase/epimerase
MSYILWTDKSWAETLDDLAETFAKWGVTEWETNHPRGANKRGDVRSATERAVRLTYYKNGHQVNLVMDKQRRAVDNLRVLYLAVEAMRLNKKRGIAEVVQSAYMQLEAPKPISIAKPLQATIQKVKTNPKPPIIGDQVADRIALPGAV